MHVSITGTEHCFFFFFLSFFGLKFLRRASCLLYLREFFLYSRYPAEVIFDRGFPAATLAPCTHPCLADGPTACRVLILGFFFFWTVERLPFWTPCADGPRVQRSRVGHMVGLLAWLGVTCRRHCIAGPGQIRRTVL